MEEFEGQGFEEFSVDIESFEYKQTKIFDRIFRVTEGGSFCQHPCVHDGLVYVGSLDRNVYAIKVDTGELVWKFQAEGGFVPSSPMISEGILYIGSYDRNIYALDCKTGRLVWKFQTQDKVTATPTISEGRVYVGSNDYNMYCLDAKTGRMIWKFRTQREVPSMATPYKNMILFGSYDRFLYCIDRDRGRLIWKFETQGDVYNEWPLLIHDGIVYAPSFDNILRAIDVKTGRLIWKYTTGMFGGMHSSPLFYKGRLYAVNREGVVHCLTLEGKAVWKYRINYVMSLIEIDEDRIYLGAGDYNLHCLDINGKLLWKFQTQDEIWWKPTVFGNKVFFACMDCNLYCVDKNTHRLIWKFRGQGAPSYMPPPFESYELTVNKTSEDEGLKEVGERKTYDIEGLEEEKSGAYKSRVTYQVSTQYASKGGKYQVDSDEEEL